MSTEDDPYKRAVHEHYEPRLMLAVKMLQGHDLLDEFTRRVAEMDAARNGGDA